MDIPERSRCLSVTGADGDQDLSP